MEKENLETQKRLANAAEIRNKLYEIEVLCKAAETAKSMAKCSVTRYYEQGYIDAEELTMTAIAKIRELLRQKGN